MVNIEQLNNKLDNLLSTYNSVYNYFKNRKLDTGRLWYNLTQMYENGEVEYKYINKYSFIDDEKEIAKYIKRQKENTNKNVYDYIVHNRLFYDSDEQYKLFTS